MKAAALVLSAAFLAATASPAHAQMGGLGKIGKIADKGVKAKDDIDKLHVSDKEERQIGENVSERLRQRFGVVQDKELTKYVSLVGTVVAQQSSRPALDWKFIVLDTDGVNAYAAPGGFVHVTRGLLGLIKNEAELAGVLGHEVTHIANKHTVKSIENANRMDLGVEYGTSKSGWTTEMIARIGEKVFKDIFEGQWSQGDENDADHGGAIDANKAGYDPHGLVTALEKLDARNASSTSHNGWFASHPETKDRISKVTKQISSEKLTGKALVAARYKQYVPFDAKALSEITAVDAGASGLAAGDKKKEADKKDEPKKKNGLASIGSGKQQASAQQTSSAGARGVGNDTYAKGGSNPAIVAVKLAPEDITAFKKGIA